jgi:DNA modification methylase
MKFDPEQGKRLQEFYEKVFSLCLQKSKPGSYLPSFSQPRLVHRMEMAAETAGYEIRDTLIWHHSGGQGKAFKQDHFVKKMKLPADEKAALLRSLDNRKTPQLRPEFETIVLAQKPKEGTFIENWQKWGVGLVKLNFPDKPQPTTIFKFPKPRSRGKLGQHFTIKPVELMSALIEVFSAPGDLVLDPFEGTGTTGEAAIRSGRKYIGIEKSQEYSLVSRERLRDKIKYAKQLAREFVESRAKNQLPNAPSRSIAIKGSAGA